MNDHCPFQVGEKVRYQPTDCGYAVDAMGDRLTPGNPYTVKAITDGEYVVVSGDTHPGGGLYWTELEAA